MSSPLTPLAVSTPRSSEGTPVAVTGSPDLHTISSTARGSSGAGASVLLQQEALTTLAALLPTYLPLVPPTECAALLAILMALAQTPQPPGPPCPSPAAPSRPSSSPSPTPSTSSRPPPPDMALELQRLALQALTSCCMRCGSAPLVLSAEQLQALQACVLAVLQQSCRGPAQPIESPEHARLYGTLLKLACLVMGESKKAWVPTAAQWVECLRKFFLYGLDPRPLPPHPTPTPPPVAPSLPSSSTRPISLPPPTRPNSSLPLPHGHPGPPAPPAADQAAVGRGQDSGHLTKQGSVGQGRPSGGAYCPPHLRRQKAARSSSEEQGACSDSDASDSEGAAGQGQGVGSDRFNSSRVRLALLSVLQAMAKGDSRALHPHWTSLLPVQQPLQPRPLTPHLITVLLHDPQPKVRSLAASALSSLLEGAAPKGFLAVASAGTLAAAGPRAPPFRGFITLSTSLGSLAVCLVASLLHGLLAEGSPLVLAALLRALCSTVAALPLDRLPRQLLPLVLEVLQRCWQRLGGGGAAGVGVGVGVGAEGGSQQGGSAGPPCVRKAAGGGGVGGCGGVGAELLADMAWLGESAAESRGLPGPLPAAELAALQPAYLACLAEVFGTKQPQSSLAAYLAEGDSGGQQLLAAKGSLGWEAGASSGLAAAEVEEAVQKLAPRMRPLMRQLMEAAVSPLPALRIEALAALKGMAGHYPHLLPGMWPLLLKVAALNLAAPASPSSSPAASPRAAPGSTPRGSSQEQPLYTGADSPADKARQLAVKLAAEYLGAWGKLYGLGPPPTDPPGGEEGMAPQLLTRTPLPHSAGPTPASSTAAPSTTTTATPSTVATDDVLVTTHRSSSSGSWGRPSSERDSGQHTLTAQPTGNQQGGGSTNGQHQHPPSAPSPHLTWPSMAAAALTSLASPTTLQAAQLLLANSQANATLLLLPPPFLPPPAGGGPLAAPSPAPGTPHSQPSLHATSRSQVLIPAPSPDYQTKSPLLVLASNPLPGPGPSPGAALGARALAALAQGWQQTLALLIPAASPPSPAMVAAAALAALAECPSPLFALLPTPLQHRCVLLAVEAAVPGAVQLGKQPKTDSSQAFPALQVTLPMGQVTPAVQAAACKALGMLGSHPEVQAEQQLWGQVFAAVQACLASSVLSVRIAAAAALAMLCSCLPAAQPPLPTPPHRLQRNPPASPLALAPASLHSSPPTDRQSHPSGCDASVTLVTHKAGQGHVGWRLPRLCAAALVVAQGDVDKVRAHGVAALGALLAVLPPAALQPAGMASQSHFAPPRVTPGSPPPSGAGLGGLKSADESLGGQEQWEQAELKLDLSSWVEEAIGCLQSCLTTGNMKVQYSACLATQTFLTNARALEIPGMQRSIAPLLVLLVMLVRDCGNFKIRTLAAASLGALPSRQAYGHVFTDALLVLCNAIDSLDNNVLCTPDVAGDVTQKVKSGLPLRAEQQASGDVAVSHADGGQADHPPLAPDDESARNFPNFRYAAALNVQLRTSLLHLLALAEVQDAGRAKDAVGKRLELVCQVLCEEMASVSASLGLVQGSSEASSVLAALPADPFGSETGTDELHDQMGTDELHAGHLAVGHQLQVAVTAALANLRAANKDSSKNEQHNALLASALGRARSLAAAGVTLEILQRYLQLEQNFWAKLVWGIQAELTAMKRKGSASFWNKLEPVLHQSHTRAQPAQMHTQTRPDQTRPDQTRPDQTRPDQTRPDQTRPDQTRPDQTRPDQTRPDQTRPDQTRPDQTRPDQTRPDQTRPDQTRPDQTRPDQTRPDQTRPDQTRPAQPSPAQPSPAQPSPAQPSPAQPSPAQPSVTSMPGGFRERLLGDPSFPVKVAIECGIGVVTKVTAESTKRGDSFWPEIDFVGANVVMAIIADFMLTWIPAPTLSYVPRQVSNNALLTFLSRCPDNAFQRVPAGMEPFTLLQRMGAIARNGGKLLGVGFGASMLGVGITNVLIALRQMMDPGWAPPNKPQDVLATSAAYGVYMSVSSNLRYQLIAGVIEERGIETIFKGQHQLCHVLSFIVRTANTFVGSLLWVDFPQPPCSQGATQPAASEPGPSTPPPAKRIKRTKAEQAAEPTLPTKCKGKAKGKAAEAKPAPRPGRWLDRDCNAALNMQRIGESRTPTGALLVVGPA
ncbi:hypothetical protein QJQ45_003280 [Haematococcus lacustris]|nr:hypothetical protein QJQ45_003280 [Haematococcus lacustris]